jgi:hypothetical protein
MKRHLAIFGVRVANDRERRAGLAVTIALVLTVSACSGPPARDEFKGGDFNAALSLKHAGYYADAAENFEKMARLGGGWEVAQFHLGECQLALADQAVDSEQVQKFQQEGFFWIHLAAQSDIAEAQGRLAELYWHGLGTEKRPLDAGKFLVLYERHPSTRALGLNVVSRELADEIRRALGPNGVMQAEVLAQGFVPARQPVRGVMVRAPQGRQVNRALRSDIPGGY